MKINYSQTYILEITLQLIKAAGNRAATHTRTYVRISCHRTSSAATRYTAVQKNDDFMEK